MAPKSGIGGSGRTFGCMVMRGRYGYGSCAAALAVGALVLVAGCGTTAVPDHGRNSSGYTAPAPAPVSGVPEDEASGASDQLSTFALDVDTASYGFAQRTLAGGALPDPKTVRAEEFVNSFRQDYPQPKGNGFSVTTDGARISGVDGDGWSLMRVGLATREAEDGQRPPAVLTFVVDVSGSMGEPGRLDLVRKALGMTVDALRADDAMGIVTFSGTAKVALPVTRLGGGSVRSRIHEVIDGLRPDASTNLAAGVKTGYAQAERAARQGATNRVVLLSDALANTGDTSADGILRQIGDARSEYGITLFGVGVGSSYGDELMEQLADKGDGHTSYVSTTAQARKVFVEQLPVNVGLRARDAKAQVAFDPATVAGYRLIGYQDRAVADGDFRDDRVDGGEIGPGHTVTALYAVRLKEGADGHVATATVRWQDPSTRAPREASGQVDTAALSGDLWTGKASPRLRVDAVAAYFADILRTYDTGEEQLPDPLSLAQLSRHAHALAKLTEDSAVTGLATAIDQARELRA